MSDPISQIVSLLQPKFAFSKRVAGSGHWTLHEPRSDVPFYCAVLEGGFRLETPDGAEIVVGKGDFLLVPCTAGFTMTSLDVSGDAMRVEKPFVTPDGTHWLGPAGGHADAWMQVGHCAFAAPDNDLLASLLPQVIHVRGGDRLSTLVHLVADESGAARPAREIVLERLLEVLLIETLRAAPDTGGAAGLLRGLSDPRLVCVIRAIHDRPDHPWTLASLANEAALSRSAFCARFTAAVGVAPIAYLAAWRMALAKQMLRRAELPVTEVASRVGYATVSGFSVAFSRATGVSPARFARDATAQ